MAENFQKMFLKVILDRLEFVSKFVELSAESHTRTSTFYLLLPVILKEYNDVMKVDWKTVKRCLCSPIFRHPDDTSDKKVTPFDNHLHLANGYRSVRDVENSLVYTPHTNNFFFVTNVIYEKNGFSPYKDSDTSSYVDHLHEKYVYQVLLLMHSYFTFGFASPNSFYFKTSCLTDRIRYQRFCTCNLECHIFVLKFDNKSCMLGCQVFHYSQTPRTTTSTCKTTLQIPQPATQSKERGRGYFVEYPIFFGCYILSTILSTKNQLHKLSKLPFHYKFFTLKNDI